MTKIGRHPNYLNISPKVESMKKRGKWLLCVKRKKWKTRNLISTFLNRTFSLTLRKPTRNYIQKYKKFVNEKLKQFIFK